MHYLIGYENHVAELVFVADQIMHEWLIRSLRVGRGPLGSWSYLSSQIVSDFYLFYFSRYDKKSKTSSSSHSNTISVGEAQHYLFSKWWNPWVYQCMQSSHLLATYTHVHRHRQQSLGKSLAGLGGAQCCKLMVVVEEGIVCTRATSLHLAHNTLSINDSGGWMKGQNNRPQELILQFYSFFLQYSNFTLDSYNDAPKQKAHHHITSPQVSSMQCPKCEPCYLWK